MSYTVMMRMNMMVEKVDRVSYARMVRRIRHLMFLRRDMSSSSMGLV